ncbi:MAG TPA: AraC family transcriptional regulator [Candidatus Synoicihabitans sp.]|nr:AraC family transcriptional regulator [Candidatus Synoicihabitans sp.]
METPSTRLKHRDAWARQLAGGQFRLLFDHLASTLFFAKDLDGRITFANTAFARRCGYATEEDIIGLTDDEIFPPALAQHYRAGDRKVLDTGRPVLGIIELFPNALGQPEWYQTNKLPLHDADGRLCGLCGTVRSYEGARAALQPYLDLAKAVDYLKEHYAEKLDVAKLAKLSHLSVRHFERRFRQTFQMSPRAYLIRLRVAIAADQLSNTGRRPTEIALESGFYDHSDFSRQFRKIMGVPPSTYRRAHHRG